MTPDMRTLMTIAEARPPATAAATIAYVYHGTISRNLLSIYTHGLTTEHSGENWSFDDNPAGVLYFTSSEDQAKYYASSVAANHYYRLGASGVPFIVMLRVRVSTGLNLISDPRSRGDFYTSRDIPASRLEVKLHDQWQSLGVVNQRTIESISHGDWDEVPGDDEEEEA